MSAIWESANWTRQFGMLPLYYGTCIKYPNLEQCQSHFSLFKFLINVSTFLISWIKFLFFSKQRHTSVSVQTDFGVIVFNVIAYKNIVISSMD